MFLAVRMDGGRVLSVLTRNLQTPAIGTVIVLLLWLGWAGTAPAWQTAEVDDKKVSNDQPTRPMQMPAASSEVREAFDDFERFKRRGAWERASKALYTIPEPQTERFVDGTDGFIIPVARKRHAVLAGLTPEGLAAYRLFYDADAQKLFEAAEGAIEQANLEKLYSAYFLTTIGDNAADRLGDLYFEKGRFDRAADCWLAVLRDRTDSDLAPALLAVKAAVALAKAGRRTECQALRSEILERYPDEVVTVAGQAARSVEHLKRIIGDARTTAVTPPTAASATSPTLGGPVAATWQLRFGASVTAGMTAAEVVQWEANSFSQAVPRATIEGKTLFANYLGHIFAVDLETGKLKWRSASFHNVDINAMSDQARLIDPTRYAIVAAPGFVYSLGADLKEMNPQQAQARLICRRADNGEIVWQSTDFPDLATLNLVGLPILAKETLLIAAKSVGNNNGQDNLPRQSVLALRPHDGKLLWKTEVGTFRETQRYSYYGMRDTAPQPRLAFHAGAVYIDTHMGILGRLDLESGHLDWGYGYPTEPIKGEMRFFSSRMTQDPSPLGAAPLANGETLLIKGAKSDHIAVIDPGRMAVVWDRPIARSARPVGLDDQTVFLGGPDLEALDRADRSLRWSLPMPSGSEDGKVLVRPDGLWQFTPRGIFEVDATTGRVRRIFRGDDTNASGGDLLLTDQWLLAISNQTISAYPRTGSEAERADAATGTGAKPATATSSTGGSDD